jgi:hypothetical protein
MKTTVNGYWTRSQLGGRRAELTQNKCYRAGKLEGGANEGAAFTSR